MEKGRRNIQYLVTLSVSVAAFTMGITSSWPSAVIPKFAEAANSTNTTNITVHMDKDNVAWMVSLNPIGFIAGNVLAGLVMDRLGRRRTLLLSKLPYGVGMVLLVTAVHPWMLYLMMFLWNIGVGMLSNVMPLYLSEILEKDVRGTLFLVTKIAFNFGNVAMMCIGPYLAYNTLNRLIMLLPMVYFIVCWWIPESPYQYLKDGKVQKARWVLEKLRGQENKTHQELEQMKSYVQNEMQRSSSPLELFRGRQYRKAIIISAGLKLTAIMTGGVTISYYLGLIMKESGIKIDTKHAQLIFGLIRFFVSIMPSVLVDKVGRKPLLIFSFIGTGISLAAVGLYFFCLEVLHVDINTLSPYGFITLTGIILSNVISTIGYNSLVHLIAGEIFPLNIKVTAFACLGIYAGGVGFVTSKSYQALKDRIGLCGVFWIFASVSFVGGAFSKFCVVETKGKSLEEIQKQLQGDMYVEEAVIMLNGVRNGVIAAENDNLEIKKLNKKDSC